MTAGTGGNPLGGGDERLPSIGIVIPSLNQAEYLGEAIESVLRQDYPRIELVVMDGGSTDASVEIIRSFADRIAYWQSAPDRGQSAAINEGLRRCGGEIVGWLNSDDYYWGDSLWTVARAWAAFPDRGLYMGNGLRGREKESAFAPFCPRHVALSRASLRDGLDNVLQPSTFFSRRAWEEVGGLDESLHYTMDWDLVLRIGARFPAVTIDDMLAVSREYEATKTSRGAMKRAFEIVRMLGAHGGGDLTPGGCYFLLETLLGALDRSSEQLRARVWEAMRAVQPEIARVAGVADGFPEKGDAQDSVYLPIANRAAPPPQARRAPWRGLPRISVVTPSYNQAQFLGQTLDSILAQRYPELETLVFDGGSADGSVELLRRYSADLTYWTSERDRGPAHAINKGLARATGDILGWVNSDDLVSDGALWEVAKAFADDPELDMVYGNAVYIDEENRPFLADHGTHRTALYYGRMQPREIVPAYWKYVHAIPQPTVFFRRRLLERCGPLDESYHFIFDFELFWRFTADARVRKIERTQALYRIHTASKTSDWTRFLVELYRFSRPLWPRAGTYRLVPVVREFVNSYMLRHFPGQPMDARFYAIGALVGASALTRIGNPEAWRFAPRQRPAAPSPAPAAEAPRPGDPSLTAPIEASHLIVPGGATPVAAEGRVVPRPPRRPRRSFFCSYFLPRHPGHSGGEIRDFHLLRHLLSLSDVSFFSAFDSPADDRADLAERLEALHTPASVQGTVAHHPESLRQSVATRAAAELRRRGIPVLGPRYHLDVTDKLPPVIANVRHVLQERLMHGQPDFLFISPQVNPVALVIDRIGLRTRFVLASYDVEAVRIARLGGTKTGAARIALELEAKRAERFERRNLERADGVIAVSALDKHAFVERYGYAADRVLVVDNGVDPDYFDFRERRSAGRPAVVFVGSLGYPPNRDAARRLFDAIMPRVRARRPDAVLWIVGQNPDRELLARADGQTTVVTGRVDDVRPHLADAAVGCVPLLSGSGTKYKVLEALSAGVPLVCSPLAVEGLDLEHDKHVLVTGTDQETADALVRLIEDPSLAARIAREGRARVEERYSWEANLAPMEDWLRSLAEMPRVASGGVVDPR